MPPLFPLLDIAAPEPSTICAGDGARGRAGAWVNVDSILHRDLMLPSLRSCFWRVTTQSDRKVDLHSQTERLIYPVGPGLISEGSFMN